MESEGGGVFRGSNRTGGDKYEEREGKRCVGIADAKVCQRCTKVLRVGELLSLIYRELCINSEAAARYGEKG